MGKVEVRTMNARWKRLRCEEVLLLVLGLALFVRVTIAQTEAVLFVGKENRQKDVILGHS